MYLDRLRAYPTEKSLTRAKGDPYPRGVAEAIGLSLDAVANARAFGRSADSADLAGLASDLLDLISLLSPEGVSRTLLYLGPSADVFAAPPAEAAAEAAADADAASAAPQARPAIDAAAIDEAIRRLADASLVTFVGDDTIIAHRLTMRAVRERAEHAGTGFLLAAKACMLLDTARASLGEPRLNRDQVRLFAQHVVALNGHIAAGPGYHEADADQTKALAFRVLHLRIWAVALLNLAGDAVTQAVAIAEPLLADSEAALGESHPGTLAMRNNLGYAYRAAGRPDDAIEQYERALADTERLSGPDHPDTLTCRNNLGVAYQAAGRAADAIVVLERTVTDRERVLGPDDRQTLTSRNNLANAYLEAGRQGDALREHSETLAARERVLGADDPDTLRSRLNLASAILGADNRMRRSRSSSTR